MMPPMDEVLVALEEKGLLPTWVAQEDLSLHQGAVDYCPRTAGVA